MRVRNLDRIFKPRRITVIGASRNPTSVGYTVLRNLISAGFGGVVYPVNPKREAIHGIMAYPDVASLPHAPDLAVVSVRAELVPGIVRECGEAGVGGMIILSAGFGEVGEQGLALEARIRQEAKRYSEMRIIGPNCLGVMVPSIGLNATFAHALPKQGNIAFISQSGPLCASVLDWANHQDIGFSHFVSVGNTVDVTIGDLIDYSGQDERTDSILLYVESITDARKFMSASRAFARTKPIVAYKAGRFVESQKAAAAHTGAMAGDDAIYNAAFARAGIIRVYDVTDMFECAELLGRRLVPRGPRLAILTNAGGPGVMATDALVARGGVVAQLSDETMAKLDSLLPPFWSHGNPVDLLTDASAQRYREATEIVLQDAGVDAALVILTPHVPDATGPAIEVAEASRKSSKPVLAAWMGADSVAEGAHVLSHAGVPTYTSPERAVNAFMCLVSYGQNIELLYETPREVPVAFALDHDRLRERCGAILNTGDEVLPETSSQALLRAYGIPTAPLETAGTAEEAVQAAQQIGYPVVLKINAPGIIHKTEVGGVALNLRDDEQVAATYRRQIETAARQRPEAVVEGVTVQPMYETVDGTELILGAKKDRVFGSIIMVGTGGIQTEIIADRVLGLPPLNERLALHMLEACRCWPILKGFRGRPPMKIDLLIEILMRLSYLVADCPEIKELDINPLLVTRAEVVALDARVITSPVPPPERYVRFAHLAIPPYPEQYEQRFTMPDGTSVLLRPIKPEDEPMWHDLLRNCSPETIRGRFHSLFHGTTHAMAARACCIDYDRELAIVAETGTDGDRDIIGVTRLVADPDHDTADFGILVSDRWQSRGLGMVLTRYCLKLAERWGLNHVTAITSGSNTRMVKIFEKLGFSIDRRLEDNLVVVNRDFDGTGAS
ncbi:MAG: bifunctional acetate--CoA ligase family protein/GNAT family N-acetyltransferase [Planctomycetota bacterium]